MWYMMLLFEDVGYQILDTTKNHGSRAEFNNLQMLANGAKKRIILGMTSIVTLPNKRLLPPSLAIFSIYVLNQTGEKKRQNTMISKNLGLNWYYSRSKHNDGKKLSSVRMTQYFSSLYGRKTKNNWKQPIQHI